jgi:hypothetical protein
MKKADNLIIVAGGNATRLEKHHQNLIPKLLLNVDDNTVFWHMINFWKSKVNHFHIILKSSVECHQLKSYVNLMFTELSNNFSYSISGSENHTFYKLLLASEVLTGSAYITWSDIYPTSIEEHESHENVIFVDKNLQHRMHYSGKQIVTKEKADGNLCGIFYISSVSCIKDFKNYIDDEKLTTIDFSEVLKNAFDSKSNSIEQTFVKKACEIIDTGDERKLLNVKNQLKTVDAFTKTRYFNTLEIDDTTVTKSSTCEKGVQLLSTENCYYDKVKSIGCSSFFPKKLSFEQNKTSAVLKLERLEGSTIFEYLQSKDKTCKDIKLAKSMYQSFLDTITYLHFDASIHTSKADFINAMVKEYVHVTESRLKSVNDFISKIASINGKLLSIDSSSVIVKLKSAIHDETSVNETALLRNLRFIHGDTNTSNVFKTTNDLKFIDPRGSFGSIKFYGDKRYDYAKFLYGLSGYDAFNTATDIEFSATEDENFMLNINYSLPPHYDLDDLTDDVFTKLLVSIIWLKLTAYIINNPIKTIIAYCHGIQLFQKYYQQHQNLQKTINENLSNISRSIYFYNSYYHFGTRKYI